jgi:aminoglycoside 2''-phosphotransferase
MDVQAYHDLLTRELPELAIHSAIPIEAGWDSFVLEVNEEWIFRFPRRDEVMPGLEKELRLLPLLAGRLPAAIPQVEYLARRKDGQLLFMGYHKIPGAAVSAAALERDGVAKGIADFLSTLHNLPLELAGQAGIPGQDALTWRTGFLDFLDWACEHAFPLLSPLSHQQAQCLWEDYLQDEANFTFQPCLIHCDLDPEHILVNQDGLSGVIDWEDAAAGDPAIDFAGLYWMNTPAGFARVLAHYSRPVEPSFERRAAFYATIAPFHEIRFGLEKDDPGYTHAGIRAVEQRLANLSP